MIYDICRKDIWNYDSCRLALFMKNNDLKPSEAELEILQVIWNLQPVTVRQVHEVLSHKKKVGYTTTLKQMQRMVSKNFLTRNENEKGQTYTALLKEEETKHLIFDKMIKTLFKGSAMDLVMHALGNNISSKEDLKTLKEWLDKKEGGNDE